MNRRSFFGFACGGAVAAPAALIGAAAVSRPHNPSPREVKEVMMNISAAVDQAAFRKIEERVMRGTAEAIARYDARRGGSDARRG